jgi:transposase
MLPTNFPPWAAVHQQTQRWIDARCFEAMVHDLLALLRVAEGRDPDPTAVVLDGRTLRSTPKSGHRAGYDGHKRIRGSKVHAAVDTLGHLLAVRVTPAVAQERAQVAALAEAVQEATGDAVELAYVDQAAPARTRRSTSPTTASGWRWSSWRRPSGALCCCRGGGCSSARSPERPGSGGWRKTKSGCRRRSPGSTSSPLPVSCFTNCCSPLSQVHDTLLGVSANVVTRIRRRG